MSKQPPEPPVLLTRREVARLLKVSEGTIINMEHDGTLTPIRLRQAVRHRRTDIDALIAKLAGDEPRGDGS